MGLLDRLRTKYEKYNPQTGHFEEVKPEVKELTREEQFVPQTRRQIRKYNKQRDKRIYQTLKPIYDKEYAEQSVKVIKERAIRDAKNNYGRTKAQKRRDAIKNIVSGLNEMGDVLSGNTSQRQRQQQSKKGKSNRHKGQASTQQRRKKTSDPFDFDLGDFNI